MYDRSDDTSRRFRLPEDSAIYDVRAGFRLGGVPPELFSLGGSLRLRAEFPLMLHGYNVEEIFAKRFVLVNLAYRFPIWPHQDRVHLQLLADYAWVDYLRGHRLARSGLAGVGTNVSLALTQSLTLVVGYGHGIDAPRRRAFGGHDVDAQFEFKY